MANSDKNIGIIAKKYMRTFCYIYKNKNSTHHPNNIQAQPELSELYSNMHNRVISAH